MIIINFWRGHVDTKYMAEKHAQLELESFQSNMQQIIPYLFINLEHFPPNLQQGSKAMLFFCGN